jgi:hypothetical protein
MMIWLCCTSTICAASLWNCIWVHNPIMNCACQPLMRALILYVPIWFLWAVLPGVCISFFGRWTRQRSVPSPSRSGTMYYPGWGCPADRLTKTTRSVNGGSLSDSTLPRQCAKD